MNLKTHNVSAAVAAFLMAVATVHSQSVNYTNTIVSLNPAGYWPMHEVAAAAPGDIETNCGTLGALGKAYGFTTKTMRSVM